MGEYIAYAFIATLMGKLAQGLLKKDPDGPVVDSKPTSSSDRGKRIPIVVGRRLVGAYVAWFGNREAATEAAAGGKGGTGGSSSQLVYYEDAHHILAVGPGQALHKIRVDGKIVYNPAGGINKVSHPSGTAVTVPGYGTFTIYWGEEDSPIDTFLGSSVGIQVSSRWKFAMRLVWRHFRLGGFPRWPAIEYEVECRPYKDGNLAAVDYNSLPAKLTDSAEWLNNEIGSSPALVFSLIDGYNSLEVSNGGTIKIGGNHTADFPNRTSKASVLGQPYGFYADKLLNVVASSYNAGEAYYTPTVYTIALVGDFHRSLTNAAWVKTNVTVTAGSGGAPSTSGLSFNLALGLGFPNTVIWNESHALTGGAVLLSRFRNKLRIYVKNFGVGSFTSLTLGFLPFNGATTNSHTVDFQWFAGEVQITNHNGAKGSSSIPGGFPLWKMFEVVYVANHGNPASTLLYNMVAMIDVTGSGGTVVVSECFRYDDDGTSHVGVTTMDFQENLPDVDDNIGSLQAYKPGIGPGGPNAAHILYQLLFETHPHGAGLDINKFSLESLEALGVAIETEGLRTNLYGPDGREFEAMIATILQDVGIFCTWDRMIGKFVFTLIREPDTIPAIPEELVSSPLPEQIAMRESVSIDKLLYGFADSFLNYRDNVAAVSDDGRASIAFNQKGDIVQMPTVIDTDTALVVSERRANESMVAQSKSSVTVLGAGGDLYPGMAVEVFGLEAIQRIVETKVDAKSRRIVHEMLLDSYALAPITFQLAAQYVPPPPMTPQPDAAVQLVEFPAILMRANARSAGVLRIRSVPYVDSAVVYLSSDNLTYSKVLDNGKYVTGGRLMEDMTASTSVITTGPIIYGIGPDVAALSKTLGADDWALGRQLLFIGGEIMFLQAVVPLGENLYRLDGIKRKQYRTSVAAHFIDDIVFIVDPQRIDALFDPLVRDGQLVYAKAQPKVLGEATLLSAVPAVSKTMTLSGPASPTTNYDEVPAGTINGVNAVFTLAFAPNPPSSLVLFRNGIYQRPGASFDYVLGGVTITFNAGAIPQTGDSVTVPSYVSES